MPRGLGIGFYSNANGTPTSANGFSNFKGLILDVDNSGNATNRNGALALTNASGDAENIPVTVLWPTATLGTFSTTIPYVVTYSINTLASTGGIFNVSVTNPVTGVTDTADYLPIDNYAGPNIFTPTNTAFAGFMDSASNFGQQGLVSNFQVGTYSPVVASRLDRGRQQHGVERRGELERQYSRSTTSTTKHRHGSV